MSPEFLSRFDLPLLGKIERGSFTLDTRAEIGERDRWTCSGLGKYGCYWEHHFGDRAFFQNGFNMQAAHLPNLHGKRDFDPEAGRMLCTIDHGIEEILRGNIEGAIRLLSGNTIYTYSYISRHGGRDLIVTVDDLFYIAEKYHIRSDYNRRLPRNPRWFHPKQKALLLPTNEVWLP